MANQDLSQQGSMKVLTKQGIQDIAPISQTRAWLKINGLNGIFGSLQRFNAKRLSFSLNPRPILAIHSNERGQLFIQTDQSILMYNESELTSDTLVADEDSSILIDDPTGQSLINA